MEGHDPIFRNRDRVPHFLNILAVVSLAAFGAYKLLPGASEQFADPQMLQAAGLMDTAIRALGDCAGRVPGGIDTRTDLNRTGLIGREASPITTSLGQLEAKRTSTNPNFAGLMVMLLKLAGARRGDAVAIGASSSFPALIVATLAAVETIGAKPVMIASLGASNWGANDPEFSWLEMSACLRRAGILDVRPIALAVGGERDNGEDMGEEGRELLLGKIREVGIEWIREPSLSLNVGRRMVLYETGAAPAAIKAFVNIGGSWANMGTDSSILEAKPGLTNVAMIPPAEKRGVMQEMALRKIPVIHLLFVKGLAERYGLPWDPVPLPKPGQGPLYGHAKQKGSVLLIVGIVYLVLIVGLTAYGLRSGPRRVPL